MKSPSDSEAIVEAAPKQEKAEADHIHFSDNSKRSAQSGVILVVASPVR